ILGKEKGVALPGFYELRGRVRNFAKDLARLTEDPEAPVRVAAARALGNVEGDPRQTIPPLKRLLADSDVEVRRAAAAALHPAVDASLLQFQSGQAPPGETALGGLAAVLSESQIWRGRARGLLGSIREVAPAAAAGLKDDDAVVRRISARAARAASDALMT